MSISKWPRNDYIQNNSLTKFNHRQFRYFILFQISRIFPPHKLFFNEVPTLNIKFVLFNCKFSSELFKILHYSENQILDICNLADLRVTQQKNIAKILRKEVFASRNEAYCRNNNFWDS